MEERRHAICIDPKRGPLIHYYTKSQARVFVELNIQLRLELKELKSYDNLVLLITADDTFIVRKDDLGFGYLLTLDEARDIYDELIKRWVK